MAPRRRPRKPRKTARKTTKARATKRRTTRRRPATKKPARARRSRPRRAPARSGLALESTRPVSRGGATIAADPIEALRLGDVAARAARALLAAFPSVVFTSGLRDKAAQARAMASNVVKNRQWIVQTYRDTVAARACQKWVDGHAEATTQAAIGAGLLGVLDGLTEAEVGGLSKHLSGAAFDVQPVTKDADAIKQAIRGLPGVTKFLEREGGLVRWHAEF